MNKAIETIEKQIEALKAKRDKLSKQYDKVEEELRAAHLRRYKLLGEYYSNLYGFEIDYGMKIKCNTEMYQYVVQLPRS